MSFLQQLKNQAREVQTLEANALAVEAACTTIWHYLADLVPQLNVIEPDAARISLDGKTPWPAMKLTDFRFDARKADLRGREVTHHIGLGWRLLPRESTDERGSVSVNFPPDLDRVQARLGAGQVKHERLEVRHPESHKLQAITFEHDWAARASVVFTPEHDKGVLAVRVAAVAGLEVRQLTLGAAQVTEALMDELAKAIVGQPNVFL
jgi:hypothetical protein